MPHKVNIVSFITAGRTVQPYILFCLNFNNNIQINRSNIVKCYGLLLEIIKCIFILAHFDQTCYYEKCG